MKGLTIWHKKQGDEITFYNSFEKYDKVYSSKIFTWSNDFYLRGNIEKGGTGYNLFNVLPDEIEHICPDYDLYETDCSYGFLTRGCIRKCPWCIVPTKEGPIRPHAEIEEFLKHKNVIIMDNNILACDHGIKQIEKIAKLGIKVDFNQGLDSRLIDDSVANLLSKIKWLHPLRMACDSQEQIAPLIKAVTLLRWHNVRPIKYFVYVLVTKELQEVIERIKIIKGMHLDPFAQPFRNGEKPNKIQKDFARWVNHKAIFNSVSFENYKIG